jgi:equilibrative nucleoside transporter 1/2/3
VNEGIFRDDLVDDHASIDEGYTDEVDEAAVFTAIKGPAACIFLVFTVTLALFPSFTSELASNRQCRTHFRLHNDLYVPFSFVFFNIGDLVGRMLAEKVPVQRIRHLSRKLVIFGTLRSLFLPVFLLCKTNLNSVHASNFVVPSDIFSSVVLFTFAVTNGLLVSTAFMHAPHLIAQTTELQERASEMMTFAVYFGLLSGSFLAFPFMELVTKI